jgi:hypothetical protein
MSTTGKNIDKHCPLCGEENICAVSMGKTIEECWCNNENISAMAINEIPESEKFKRCLCQACARNTGELALGR